MTVQDDLSDDDIVSAELPSADLPSTVSIKSSNKSNSKKLKTSTKRKPKTTALMKESYVEDDSGDESGDDVPEEVLVSTAILTAPDSKVLLKRKAKMEQKEKNRKRDEMYKAQKKAKLDQFKSAAPLPADLLERVADAEPETEQLKVENKHTVFHEEEPDPQNDDGDSGISDTSKITAKQVSHVRPRLSATAIEFRNKYRRGVTFAVKPSSGVTERELQLQKEKADYVFKTRNLLEERQQKKRAKNKFATTREIVTKMRG